MDATFFMPLTFTRLLHHFDTVVVRVGSEARRELAVIPRRDATPTDLPEIRQLARSAQFAATILKPVAAF